MSKYYEKAIVGEDTGKKDGKGNIIYSGGLKSILSFSTIHDELIQTVMNDIYFNLCIYEFVFEREKDKGWKSSESKSHTQELHRIAKTLKDNFKGKIESYKRVYDIIWTEVPVDLSDSIFDERWNELRIAGDPIGQPDRNIKIKMPILSIKRKAEATGMGLTFVDFLDASKSRATTFENVFDTDKKGLYELGNDLIKKFQYASQLPSHEYEKRIYDNWLKNASVAEKAIYNFSLRKECLAIWKKTPAECNDMKCTQIISLLDMLKNKQPPYENATAQDVIQIAKEIKRLNDELRINGKPISNKCNTLLSKNPKGEFSDTNYLSLAFKHFGLDINRFDDNFDPIRNDTTTPFEKKGHPMQSATDIIANSGLTIPKGYTDERPTKPIPKDPQTNSTPQRKDESHVKPTGPNNVQPQNPTSPSPKEDKSVPPTTRTIEKKTKQGSLWWLWLLLVGGGIYVINKQKEEKYG